MKPRGYVGGRQPSSPPARAQRRRSSLRVLAQRNFAPYFLGNLLSNCGTWFQAIAQALLVYRLTGSSFMVGLVNFAQFAGVVLLAPWAGPAADRFERRQLLIATQVGATVVSGLLAVLVGVGWGTMPVILGLVLLLGLTTAFSAPAIQAILPALVPREDLAAAIAMNSVTFNLARAIGPVAGALVVARLGVAPAIGLNSLSYLAFVGGLLLVHPAPRAAHPRTRVRFLDSVRLVRHTPHLLVLILAVAAVSFTMDPITTVTPSFATRILHRPDTLAGVLLGAFGAGAVIASLFPFGGGLHEIRKLIPPMLALMGAGMIGFAGASRLGFVLAGLALAGFGYLAGQTRATTLLQLEVEDHERGRIMALWSVAFLGSRPLASLLDGAMAAALGPRGATLLLSLPALAAAAAVWLWRPPAPAPAEPPA